MSDAEVVIEAAWRHTAYETEPVSRMHRVTHPRVLPSCPAIFTHCSPVPIPFFISPFVSLNVPQSFAD